MLGNGAAIDGSGEDLLHVARVSQQDDLRAEEPKVDMPCSFQYSVDRKHHQPDGQQIHAETSGQEPETYW